MPRPLSVGFLGLGGVAQGLLELWTERPDPRFRIAFATDSKGAVLGPEGVDAFALLSAKRGAGLANLRGARYEQGLSPPEAAQRVPCEILLNLLPCNYEDGGPALGLVRSALESGTHVVTAEKASLVLGFEALRRASQAGRSHLRYSACVGGSVPFIPILEWIAQAHRIRRITGVLNATTTYILSELEARRHSPDELLQQAHDLGILERDPRLDIDGHDLAAKAVLVHNTVYPDPLPWNRAQRRGIREFLDDPRRLRVGTRLVATVEPGAVRVDLPVLPMHSPLRVYGLENALIVETPHAGELHVRGVGAGGRGTATNVYGDLLWIANAVRGGESPDAAAALPQAALHPHL